MRKKYIFIALLFFCFLICTYYGSSYNNIQEVKEVFNIADLKANCDIKEIKDITDKYDISVYYPQSSYINLNTVIEDKMKYYVDFFKNEIEGLSLTEGRKYQMQITFSSYEYEDYISYVFEILEDYGGAHPNITIWTISYNIKEDKIIDMRYLVDKNKEILNVLSQLSYDNLKNNEKIKENYVENMLLNGTKANEENFLDFAYTTEGLKIFFERYSVAPYSSGEFTVTIPYDKLNII